MKIRIFHNSLIFKLSFLIVIILLLSSVLLSYIIISRQENFLERESRKKSLYLAKMLSEQLVEPFLYEEKFTLYKILDSAIKAEPNFLLLTEIYTPQKELLLSIARDNNLKASKEISLENIGEFKEEKFDDHYEIIIPITARHYGPIGYLRLGFSFDNWYRGLRETKRNIVLMVFLIVLLGIGTTLFMVKKIIQPAQMQLLRGEKFSALGQFAAGLAHEIKNPLTTIKMLIQNYLEEGNPLEKKDLEIIEKELNRIDKLVKDFLRFARVDKGVKEKFDLQEALTEIIDLIKPELERAKISLKLNFPEKGIWIYGDKDGLKQVFLNLILNAYQAIDSNSKGVITITLFQEKEEVHAIIEDNGLGIPTEHIPKIFDPFFTTKSEGTGMGLAIVKSIIKEHMGQINISSQINKGTKVKITLPIEKP